MILKTTNEEGSVIRYQYAAGTDAEHPTETKEDETIW